MFRPSICTEAILLQAIVIYVTTSIGQFEKMGAVINLKPVPELIYIKAEILESNYTIFQETFMDIMTKSISLKYKIGSRSNWSNNYIENIKNQSNDVSLNVTYFRCSINQFQSSILCIKNVSCSDSFKNYCPHGFGISWLYDKEYLISENLQNTTIECFEKSKVTCYTIKSATNSTQAILATKTSTAVTVTTSHAILTNKTSTAEVAMTHVILNPKTSTTEATTPIRSTTELSTESTEKFISTPIYTINSTNSEFISTNDSEQSLTGTSSTDSAGAIAGSVIASVVIAVIIIVIVILVCVKHKVKIEGARNATKTNLELQMAGMSSEGYRHDLQTSNLSEHKNGKSKVMGVSYNEKNTKHYGTKTNKYTNTGTLRNDTHQGSVFQSISDYDYTDIDEDQSSNLPDTIIPHDKDSYYCTIRINQGSNMSKSVMSDLEDGSYGNHSAGNELNHNNLLKCVFKTENKSIGFKNIREMKGKTLGAPEHKYNNIEEENKTIVRNEPTTNVYSKLRENIRHFEHTYGDVGVSIQSGEDNSTTLAEDRVYFTLETEAQC